MSFYLKGGIPFARRVPSGQTDPVLFPSETISLYVSGAQGTKIFFSRADFESGAHFITLPASGVWQGPARCGALWVSGGGDVEVLGLCLSR